MNGYKGEHVYCTYIPIFVESLWELSIVPVILSPPESWLKSFHWIIDYIQSNHSMSTTSFVVQATIFKRSYGI